MGPDKQKRFSDFHARESVKMAPKKKSAFLQSEHKGEKRQISGMHQSHWNIFRLATLWKMRLPMRRMCHSRSHVFWQTAAVSSVKVFLVSGWLPLPRRADDEVCAYEKVSHPETHTPYQIWNKDFIHFLRDIFLFPPWFGVFRWSSTANSALQNWILTWSLLPFPRRMTGDDVRLFKFPLFAEMIELLRRTRKDKDIRSFPTSGQNSRCSLCRLNNPPPKNVKNNPLLSRSLFWEESRSVSTFASGRCVMSWGFSVSPSCFGSADLLMSHLEMKVFMFSFIHCQCTHSLTRPRHAASLKWEEWLDLSRIGALTPL